MFLHSALPVAASHTPFETKNVSFTHIFIGVETENESDSVVAQCD